MTPIEILQAAKRSVAAAAYFDLGDFCYCLAPHVCRAAGDTVYNSRAILPDGSLEHVSTRAYTLLFPNVEDRMPLLFIGGMTLDHKREAFCRIDNAIEWIGHNTSPAATTPVSIPIEVLEEELVFA